MKYEKFFNDIKCKMNNDDIKKLINELIKNFEEKFNRIASGLSASHQSNCDLWKIVNRIMIEV